jgi:hypothetical protein
MLRRLAPVIALLALTAPGLAAADGEPEFTLVIKDHRFTPSELTVPAGQKIKLVVENQDATPEEFESHSLNREKIVPGGGKISLMVGPLKPGSYDFFGEFNEKTARGTLIAK